jgi:hypothetical protein
MNKIPCKYLEHWVENQSPLGSGEYWPMDMEDCTHPPFGDEQKEIEFEGWGKCDETCPGYEPMEVAICPKHGEYIKNYGCEGCEADDWETFDKLMLEREAILTQGKEEK